VDDKKITENIDALAQEEHELFERESHGTATDADRARLLHLQGTLDQCWDLLRQRRALREFGENPDLAKVRPAKIVENYEQ